LLAKQQKNLPEIDSLGRLDLDIAITTNAPEGGKSDDIVKGATGDIDDLEHAAGGGAKEWGITSCCYSVV
jgi:hypothetical protein